MRLSSILFVFILIILEPRMSHAQDPFSFGLKSSYGLHGVEQTLRWENKKESRSSIDIGIRRPKVSYSLGFLLRYAARKNKRVNCYLNLEAGYNYSSMKREWHFRRGYNNNFTQFSSEIRIIHDLKAHYFILPATIDIEFGKVICSIGLVGTRALSASIDRTKKSRVNSPISAWTFEEVTWRATKEQNGDREYNVPYISQKTGYEGTIGIGYYLSKSLIVGLDLKYSLSSGFIKVYVDSDEPSHFFYGSNTVAVKLVFLK